MTHFDPRSIDDYLRGAVRAFSRQDYDTAERLCCEILAADPHHIPSLNIMGLIADQLGLHEQALVYFQKSLALDPTADRIQSHLSRVTNAALALRRAQRTE